MSITVIGPDDVAGLAVEWRGPADEPPSTGAPWDGEAGLVYHVDVSGAHNPSGSGTDVGVYIRVADPTVLGMDPGPPVWSPRSQALAPQGSGAPTRNPTPSERFYIDGTNHKLYASDGAYPTPQWFDVATGATVTIR